MPLAEKLSAIENSSFVQYVKSSSCYTRECRKLADYDMIPPCGCCRVQIQTPLTIELPNTHEWEQLFITILIEILSSSLAVLVRDAFPALMFKAKL